LTFTIFLSGILILIRSVFKYLNIMEIIIKTIKDISIINLEGEIDIYNVPKIKTAINELIELNKLRIVINFEKVPYIDSSGIGALISSRSDLKNKNGILKISNLNQNVTKIFDIMNLFTLFEIYATEEEAVKSFNNNKKIINRGEY